MEGEYPQRFKSVVNSARKHAKKSLRLDEHLAMTVKGTLHHVMLRFAMIIPAVRKLSSSFLAWQMHHRSVNISSPMALTKVFHGREMQIVTRRDVLKAIQNVTKLHWVAPYQYRSWMGSLRIGKSGGLSECTETVVNGSFRRNLKTQYCRWSVIIGCTLSIRMDIP